MDDMIRINFIRTTPDGILYSDCLFLPQDHNYTESEIETLKDAKYQEWYDYITTPREAPVIESADTEENNETSEEQTS